MSVAINTINEAGKIAACIDSVKGLAEEVMVCEMMSDDDTQNITCSLGASVIVHDEIYFVEPAPKFTIEQANAGWVLRLDADELMTLLLALRLKELAQNLIRFWSLYRCFGDWVRYGTFFNNELPRFFRKRIYINELSSDERCVHGNFAALMDHARMSVLGSENYILHLAYLTVEQYVDKTMRRYSCLEAQQYVADGGVFKIHRMLYAPLHSLFGRNLFKQGCRDGVRGLILASLFAAHRFCFWVMVWSERDKKNQESRSQLETESWRETSFVNKC